MLIAEDLLLLLTDDVTGRLVAAEAAVDAALGGANLVELSLLGRVGLSGPGEARGGGRVVVTSTEPTGDAVLDAALAFLCAAPGLKPASAVGSLGCALRLALYPRLAAQDAVYLAERRTFGLFPAPCWPAWDVRAEAEVRRRVGDSLMLGLTPEPRTAALVAFLHALRVEHKVFDPQPFGLTRRDLRKRSALMGTREWAAWATTRAISRVRATGLAPVVVGAVAGALAPW